MDFKISEKMQTIVGMITEFVNKELIPLEVEFLNTEFRDMLPVLREKQQMVKKMELWAPNYPKDIGGMAAARRPSTPTRSLRRFTGSGTVTMPVAKRPRAVGTRRRRFRSRSPR